MTGKARGKEEEEKEGVGISLPDRCAHCISDESPALFGSEAPGSARVSGA